MNECDKCYDRGWYPVWVEDDSTPYGGHEDGEAYCHCEKGQLLAEQEKAQ